MWIGIACAVFAFSVLVMLAVALKWNIYNRSTLLITLVISIATATIYFWIYNSKTGWQLLLGVVGQFVSPVLIGLLIVLFRFSRDPEREPPHRQGVIVSPADGEVINISSIPNGTIPIAIKNGHEYYLSELSGIEFAESGMTIISIEMNILNVHVNRCPIEGQVNLIRHIAGKYISLRKVEAPFINARCTTQITNGSLNIAVVQISSRLVRRVDNYLHEGQTVKLGQRLGVIRFGSQVVTIIPNREGIKVEVSIGQKVLAGSSVLATVGENYI